MFIAVDNEEVESRKLPADVVGIPVKMDLVGTLEVALRLNSATRRVYVITGSSQFDLYWEGVARRTFRPYEERVEFVYLSGLPMDDLLKQVSGLPDRSIVQYIHIFEAEPVKPSVPARHSRWWRPRSAILGFMPRLDRRLSIAIRSGKAAKVVPAPATRPTSSER